MEKKQPKKEIDTTKVNDLVSLSYRILRILLVLLIIVGIYAALVVLKELQVMPFLRTILIVLSPLFIGLVIAWLFDPFVSWMHKKGIRRSIGALISYLIFIGILILIISALVPLLYDQINDFVTNSLPPIFESSRNWIDNVFEKFNAIDGFDAMGFKTELFVKLESFATDLTSSLPELIINIIKSFFSGLGVFGVGLIIGFYLLLDFDKHAKSLFTLLPLRIRDDSRKLVYACNKPLKRFVHGAILNSTFVFVIMLVGFLIIGLKSPVLFALFCGITNVIPYIGPWIGGIPAVLVAFSQGTGIGVATLIFILIFQGFEGNLLQPIVMSKTTHLNPVTIILGLLVFGHFFGIIGMIISTPVLGALKEVIIFFDEKFNILGFKQEE